MPLDDQLIELVKHEAGLHLLFESLAEDGVGLGGDTLNHVDEDDGPVRKSEGTAHLTRKVDMPWRVHKIYEVVALLVATWLTWYGRLNRMLVLIQEGDGRGLHSDHSLLLILSGVEETQSPRKLRVNYLV